MGKVKLGIICFIIGAIVTYVGNFIYCTAYGDERGTLFFMANAFNSALKPAFLFMLVAVIVCVAALIMFWWLDKRDTTKAKLLTEAEQERAAILDAAEKDATILKSEAEEAVENIIQEAHRRSRELREESEQLNCTAKDTMTQLETVRRDRDLAYAQAVKTLEKHKQGYLQEIEGLKKRLGYCLEQLIKARQAGITNLREKNLDGQADRAQKRLDKDIARISGEIPL